MEVGAALSHPLHGSLSDSADFGGGFDGLRVELVVLAAAAAWSPRAPVRRSVLKAPGTPPGPPGRRPAFEAGGRGVTVVLIDTEDAETPVAAAMAAALRARAGATAIAPERAAKERSRPAAPTPRAAPPAGPSLAEWQRLRRLSARRPAAPWPPVVPAGRPTPLAVRPRWK